MLQTLTDLLTFEFQGKVQVIYECIIDLQKAQYVAKSCCDSTSPAYHGTVLPEISS